MNCTRCPQTKHEIIFRTLLGEPIASRLPTNLAYFLVFPSSLCPSLPPSFLPSLGLIFYAAPPIAADTATRRQTASEGTTLPGSQTFGAGEFSAVWFHCLFCTCTESTR